MNRPKRLCRIPARYEEYALEERTYRRRKQAFEYFTPPQDAPPPFTQASFPPLPIPFLSLSSSSLGQSPTTFYASPVLRLRVDPEEQEHGAPQEEEQEEGEEEEEQEEEAEAGEIEE